MLFPGFSAFLHFTSKNKAYKQAHARKTMANSAREGHVEIPGWAWLGVGAFVTIYAMFVRAKTPNYGAMTLFFWVGIGLILVGVAKMAFKKERKAEARTERQEEKTYTKQLHEQQLQWQRSQQTQQQRPAQYSIINCPHCQAKNYAASNFCHKCGGRLR